MKENVKEQVPQLILDLMPATALERGGKLSRLFLQVWDQAFVRLLSIPRATPRTQKLGHDGVKFSDAFGHDLQPFSAEIGDQRPRN